MSLELLSIIVTVAIASVGGFWVFRNRLDDSIDRFKEAISAMKDELLEQTSQEMKETRRDFVSKDTWVEFRGNLDDRLERIERELQRRHH